MAVNPYQVVANACGKALGSSWDAQVYGFLRVDPLEGNSTRDGTIPASNGIPKDSVLHFREMIFLLNCMSRYRDLHLYGLLEKHVPILTI